MFVLIGKDLFHNVSFVHRFFHNQSDACMPRDCAKIFYFFGGVTAAGLSLGRPLHEPLYSLGRSIDVGQLIGENG